MLHNFELQLSHSSEDWITLALIDVVENLNGSLLPQFIHPLSKILKRRWVWVAKPAEDFRAEGRDSFKFHFVAHVQRIADGKHSRIV